MSPQPLSTPGDTPHHTASPARDRKARRLIAQGLVQGLGVRPAIARLARERNLTGFVSNTPRGLQVVVEGSAEAVSSFEERFRLALPRGAVIEQLIIEPLPIANHSHFEIHDRIAAGTSAATVPLDLVTCHDCLQEIAEPSDRRYGYAFTSCTQCGPRYSIISAMPYDRAATSMQEFLLCSACHSEYQSETDRRFHAQTNACPNCGPHVWLADDRSHRLAANEDALHAAAVALTSGQVVALKGLGGYQLLVDATSTAAVDRLRSRKRRLTKPLAVMVRNLATAEELAVLNDAERRELTSSAGPIVVVRRRANSPLSAAISPGLPTVGLMLPTTPLHALLLDRVTVPLVTTSGNREGEALATNEATATRDLAGIADLWLHHDRHIERPIDDSVLRVIESKPCILRLARGLAPLRLPSLAVERPIIALGGHMKNAIALSNGSQAVLGPHVGDLDSVSNCNRWHEHLAAMSSLYGVSIDAAELISDSHPDYFTTQWLAERSHTQSAAFHHHAHVAAVMLEHGLDQEVLGLAWDGTGFGQDGTIWGSEALLATRSSFRRVGSLSSYPLPGGERAIFEPWRIAVALVAQSCGLEAASRLTWPEVTTQQVEGVLKLLTRPQLMPQTSSMGRLFDAVAALALGIAHSRDDGRAAMLLEFAADDSSSGRYQLAWDRASGKADWRPLIAEVISDQQQAATPGQTAMRFHRAIAEWANDLAAEHANVPLVISGGCFQNGLLRKLIAEKLSNRRSGFFEPTIIPPGDGGLAAGQLAIAAALQKERSNAGL